MSCDSNETSVEPDLNDRPSNGRVAKVEIWNTDIYTTRISHLLEESYFDKDGDILKHAKYSTETGELKNEALFSHSGMSSIETLKTINPQGDEVLQKNEYQYTPNGQIEQKKSYRADGELSSVEDYTYSSEGLLQESVIKLDNTVKVYQYDYTFADNGEISSRTVKLNDVTISRDSMHRDTEINLLKVYTFDGNEELEKSLTFRYNTRGDISSVVCHGPNRELIYRHIYQYIYHR